MWSAGDAASRTWRSKTGAGSVSVSAPYWPNTSRLIAPTRPAHSAKHFGDRAIVAGEVELVAQPVEVRRKCLRGSHSGRRRSPAAIPAATASNSAPDHPGTRADGALGGAPDSRVPDCRTATPSSPVCCDRPRAGRLRHRRDLRRASPPGAGRGGVDGVGQFGVGVHQQQGQQVVAAGDVAVHRRGHHAEVAGDGPQRQAGRPFGDQLPPARLDDLRLDPVPGVLSLAHRPSVAQKRALLLHFSRACGNVLNREHCSQIKGETDVTTATTNRISSPRPATPSSAGSPKPA